MSTQAPQPVRFDVPHVARVAVVAARFNGKIVDELLAGCLRRLKELGLPPDRIETHRVPDELVPDVVELKRLWRQTIELFDKATNPLQSRGPVAGGFGKKVANQGFGRI